MAFDGWGAGEESWGEETARGLPGGIFCAMKTLACDENTYRYRRWSGRRAFVQTKGLALAQHRAKLRITRRNRRHVDTTDLALMPPAPSASRVRPAKRSNAPPGEWEAGLRGNSIRTPGTKRFIHRTRTTDAAHLASGASTPRLGAVFDKAHDCSCQSANRAGLSHPSFGVKHKSQSPHIYSHLQALHYALAVGRLPLPPPLRHHRQMI